MSGLSPSNWAEETILVCGRDPMRENHGNDAVCVTFLSFYWPTP
jgi:hypothetical protein